MGRPGLEPGIYGLRGRSTPDAFREVDPAPHQFPTTLEEAVDPAALAAAVLEAQQVGDPRWVEFAQQLVAAASSARVHLVGTRLRDLRQNLRRTFSISQLSGARNERGRA